MAPRESCDVDLSQLVRLARHGDDAAFDAIVRRCRSEILRHLSQHAIRPHEVDEVFQEVVIRIHAALPALRDVARIRAWIRQIAYRTCVDRIRQVHGQIRIGSLEREPPDRRGAGSDANLVHEAEHMLPALVAEVADLKPKPAAALLLRALEGMTYGEIARHLGISLPCVKTYLHRTRLHLRNRLALPAEAGHVVCDRPGRDRGPAHGVDRNPGSVTSPYGKDSAR